MQSLTSFNTHFSIYYLSEQAVTLEFGNEISEDLLQQINRFNELISQYPFAGFIGVVPAYATLSVFYDSVQVMASTLPGKDSFEKVSNYFSLLQHQTLQESDITNHLITIPVCYGGRFGPDLDEVAKLHKLTTTEVINLHSDAVYKVYMIGFVPGFAYLGGMNNQLATPRKPAPRAAIPAGSVGIAGYQTGVYPMETPGGWQLIGQTPLSLFDAKRAQPALLKAGDEVKFETIAPAQFTRYSA